MIIPDDKDWTWVLEKSCADCGFDPQAVVFKTISTTARSITEEFAELLGDATLEQLTDRPDDATWSPLEYAAHVRDVCRIMLARLNLMLVLDDPDFANWDQDITAESQHYRDQDPDEVADELVAAGDAMATALAQAGLDPERVHVERFVSLPDEEDAQPAVAADAPPPQVDAAEVSLLLDGSEHHFSCGGSETLLDAAERHGIAVPHSCRVGMCASCMCQVEEGEVVLRHNDALDARDLARRWTLSCQATPATARLRVKFPG